MRINPASVSAGAGQQRLNTARLLTYLLLAIALMALDQRGKLNAQLRAWSERAVAPVYALVDQPVRAAERLGDWSHSRETLTASQQAQRETLLLQAAAMQRLDALEEENRRLRTLLGATAGQEFSYRFAELLRVSLDPYSHQVRINQGSEAGVFVGQAVLDGQGVMGQVETVTSGQARVRLISDPDHALPVQLLRTGQRSVAIGVGDVGRLVLPNLPIQSDVRSGDVLVTSGLGERFPPGFPVAVVSEIRRDTGGAFLEVSAEPLAALDRGREVLLVTVLEVPEDNPAAAPVLEAEPAAPLENATGEDS